MLKLKHFSVLLLLIGFYSSADAAVLCSNASGSVFVRTDVCRTGETQLDPVALGLKGPAGADGVDGVSGYEAVAGNFELPPNTSGALNQDCPSGKSPVGGGYSLFGDARNEVQVLASLPFSLQPPFTDKGWLVAAFNPHATASASVRVWAICITVVEESA